MLDAGCEKGVGNDIHGALFGFILILVIGVIHELSGNEPRTEA